MSWRLLIPLSLLFAANTAIAADVPATPAPAAAEAPKAEAPKAAGSWVARYDDLYQERDKGPALKEMYTLVKAEIEAHPEGYEGWWRRAELDCWQANGMADGTDLKKNVGKQCWDAGEKAVSINPDDVKGQYWAVVGMGLYSEGLGILSALSQGIEGKFKNRASLAIKLDKDYVDGGPTTVYGRFFWKLPWPKRDLPQSHELLDSTIKAHPHNLRTKLFMADTLDSQGNHDGAKALIKEILDAPLGVDKPDDRRNKKQAEQWLKDH